MKPLSRLLIGLLATLVGAAIGFGLGVAFAIGLAKFSQWQTPDDASAGSVAIVVIATAPLGGLVGAVLAATLAIRSTSTKRRSDTAAQSSPTHR